MLVRAEARCQLPVPQALSRRSRAAQEAKQKGRMPSEPCQPPWWLLALMAAAFCSRDGQEVAVVYYREGYVPTNYNQQVSTHCSLPEALWQCQRV